jgi:peptidoglycan/xylan/chitin deacetylase (PgdA/CDA1 family)
VSALAHVLRRLGATVTPSVRDGRLRVLLYHAIAESDGDDPIGLRVPPDRFRTQMQILRDEGCTVVPLTALNDARAGAADAQVAITFDDGYRSDLQATAILAEFGYPATFFLVPRFLDGIDTPLHYWERWPHLTWDEASTLAAGFGVGAHSATHRDLTTCTDGELDEELAGARRRLEQGLGQSITTMSYPHGRYDARVRDAASRAGYTIACTSRYGVNDAGATLDVRRTEISGRDSLDDFRDKVRGKYDWMGTLQRLTGRA